MARHAFVLVFGWVVFGCSSGDASPPGWSVGSPQVASPASPALFVDAGSPRVVLDPPDAATDPPEASPRPPPSSPDPPPSSNPTSTMVPSTPVPIPDASVSPPAGPITIVCVVPVTMPGETYSQRYDCEGLEGDNDQGIDFSSTGSTLGADTQCGAGHPATVPCPSGGFCRVYSAGMVLEGTCL